jgi:signal transduction histidine kinase
MVELVDDLLDVSRIQAGRSSLRIAPCKFGECLDAALACLGAADRAQAHVALLDALLAGQWERAKVERLLGNLIGNALKYDSNGLHVNVDVERRPVEVNVAVADRGMGCRRTNCRDC